jgi:hypothetical protein
LNIAIFFPHCHAKRLTVKNVESGPRGLRAYEGADAENVFVGGPDNNQGDYGDGQDGFDVRHVFSFFKFECRGAKEGIFSGVPPSPAFDWQCKDYTARNIAHFVKLYLPGRWGEIP